MIKYHARSVYSKIDYLKEGKTREEKLAYSILEYVNGHFTVGKNTLHAYLNVKIKRELTTMADNEMMIILIIIQ